MQQVKFYFNKSVAIATEEVKSLQQDEYYAYFQIVGDIHSKIRIICKKITSETGFDYEFFEQYAAENVEGIKIKGDDGKLYIRPHAGNMSYSFKQGDGYGPAELVKRLDIVTDKFITL
jgi:hypothetical protein